MLGIPANVLEILCLASACRFCGLSCIYNYRVLDLKLSEKRLGS